VVLSKPCRYAILAMVYLAEQPPARLTPIREIGESSDIPLPFLAKIVSSLSRHGLVRARRGPGGGVKLDRPPGRISVGEIVEVLDGKEEDGCCFLGLGECDESTPCPMHSTWTRVQGNLRKALHARTLGDLIRARRRAARRESC